MHCPFCNHFDSKVTDSRNAVEQNAIRRRRECLSCQKRFTTFETVDLTIQVHKRDGRYEDFHQDKLIRGLDAACRHTRISHDQVLTLAAQITADLMERQVREIDTTELGEIVMKHLKELDMIAYIRFACVYRRFKVMDELMDEIEELLPEEEGDSLRFKEAGRQKTPSAPKIDSSSNSSLKGRDCDERIVQSIELIKEGSNAPEKS